MSFMNQASAEKDEDQRCPTFLVNGDRQRQTMKSLVKREQHFTEQYQKNRPLCFNAKAFQKSHPEKSMRGDPDADATLCSPMLVAVADGVSQIEEFGIDASELPNDLLHAVEELAVAQLLPGQETDDYTGPINLLKDAYENTTSLGSTTILAAIMDNSTKIHGKLHPMIAVCSVGDCQMIVLRRSFDGTFTLAFQTEMQRIDGHAQSPLQVARVDASVDPSFDESLAIEVIENGSAVHCVSAFMGDIVIAGSDGVFDNLFIEEISDICQHMIPHEKTGQKFQIIDRHLLGEVARCIVKEAHAKTETMNGRPRNTPIGPGGKTDDTSVVVAQVVEWMEDYGEAWSEMRNKRWWTNAFRCGGMIPACEKESNPAKGHGTHPQLYPAKPNADSFSTAWGSFSLGRETSFMSGISSGPDRYSHYGESPTKQEQGCHIM